MDNEDKAGLNRDTPSITVIIRRDKSKVSLTCIEFPTWSISAKSLSDAAIRFATKVREALQTPSASADSLFGPSWRPVVDLPNERLPARLTIRFTWSWTYFTYVVTVDELPDFRLSGPLDTLAPSILILTERLSLRILKRV